MTIGESFTRFAKATARAAGHPADLRRLPSLVILVWAVTGPLFQFSDTWQLVINTGTTIVTFLMVFLIQNTQNRDSVAMQIKLDELLRAVKGAETAMADLEDLTEEELERVPGALREAGARRRGPRCASRRACRSRRSGPREGRAADRRRR